MKIILLFILLLVGCGKESTVFTIEDHKAQIDANTALSQANAEKIDLLDQRVTLLEQRVAQNEIDLLATVEALYVAIESGDVNTINILSERLDGMDAKIDQSTSDLLSQIEALQENDGLVSEDLVALQKQVKQNKKEFEKFKLSQLRINKKVNLELQKLSDKILANEQKIASLKKMIKEGFRDVGNALEDLENEFTSALDEINGRFDSIVSDLEEQIEELNSAIEQLPTESIEIVYPCGAGNGSEVLVKTPQGFLAYVQEGVEREISFSATDIVPTHLICTKWSGASGVCNKLEEVSGYTTTSSASVTFFELTKAYLTILPDGDYTTTDGYSCNFSITEGNEGGVQ